MGSSTKPENWSICPESPRQLGGLHGGERCRRCRIRPVHEAIAAAHYSVTGYTASTQGRIIGRQNHICFVIARCKGKLPISRVTGGLGSERLQGSKLDERDVPCYLGSEGHL